MKVAKPKKLDKAGWKVGTAADSLRLSEPEEVIVSMKLEAVVAARSEGKARTLG